MLCTMPILKCDVLCKYVNTSNCNNCIPHTRTPTHTHTHAHAHTVLMATWPGESRLAGSLLILLLHLFLNCAYFCDWPKLSMSYLTQSHQVFFGRPFCLITLCAKLSGTVYCNRSCLWVCGCLFVCGSVTTITRNCVHPSSPNISSWLNFGRPVPPWRGSAVGQKILAPPYYSLRTVFASLSAFFHSFYFQRHITLEPNFTFNELMVLSILNVLRHKMYSLL